MADSFLGGLRLVGLVGLVGGPLVGGWFSDWSDWSDWSEVLLRELVLGLVGLVGLVRPYCLARYNKAVSWLPYCAS